MRADDADQPLVLGVEVGEVNKLLATRESSRWLTWSVLIKDSERAREYRMQIV